MFRGNSVRKILIGGLSLLVFLVLGKMHSRAAGTMEYAELTTLLNTNPQSISYLTFVNGSNRMKVKLNVAVEGKKELVVTLPSKAGENQILDFAKVAKVPVKAEENKQTVLQILIKAVTLLLPLLGIILVLWCLQWYMLQAIGSSHRLVKQSDVAVKFADVAGNDEAKQELEEVVRYLHSPELFERMGARVPRGVLLVGPPGNGKTLLAKACAGEANVAFFDMAASQFLELYSGVGAKRVRSLFAEARKSKQAIIFIDEFDAVGGRRGVHLNDGEREQTLNQLLIEMDGFAGNQGIVVIAATNRPDVLDPAVLRPGRFDRQVEVSLPDVVGREQIFRAHTRNKPIAPDVDFKILAARCPGFSGAEIEGACNEAAMLAVRDLERKITQMQQEKASDHDIAASVGQITMANFDDGIDRIALGVARTTSASRMSEEDRKNTAIHELGHALLGEILKHGDGVAKITIMPRSRAMGYVQPLAMGDRYRFSVEQLLARLVMIMGGRAAQEELLNVLDTGAQNDIEQAYDIARSMVCRWGLSKAGLISVGQRAQGPAPELGPDLSNNIDKQIDYLLTRALEVAKELVVRHKEFILAVNPVLLQKETLLVPEWQALVKEHNLPSQSVPVLDRFSLCPATVV